jgi:hypothetical protein
MNDTTDNAHRFWSNTSTSSQALVTSTIPLSEMLTLDSNTFFNSSSSSSTLTDAFYRRSTWSVDKAFECVSPSQEACEEAIRRISHPLVVTRTVNTFITDYYIGILETDPTLYILHVETSRWAVSQDSFVYR